MNEKNEKNTDIRRTWWFENTFRFIDNLTVLNDGGEFERSYNKIDPPELQRKKKKDINTEGSFLYMNIKIKSYRFLVSLYDKRDYFPFSIIRMPYLHSNVSSEIIYWAFSANILRIARITTICNELRTSS